MQKGKQQIDLPDFNNLAIAFAGKSKKELQKTSFIFAMMNRPWLVNLGTKLTLWAMRNNLPFVESLIKHTIFDVFCGGTSLTDSQLAISKLASQQVQTVLDYGGEAKQTEHDFKASMEEILRAIDFATQRPNVSVVSIKITALAKFEVLEKIQANIPLSEKEQEGHQRLLERLSSIGQVAEEKDVAIFVDAEESWIQEVIDSVVTQMQEKYNKKKAIIFNTFQMYRHDRLAYLKQSFEAAQQGGYILGAKIVRGAYMEKERARAAAKNYPSPIQKDKAATDKDYDLAIKFCVQNYQYMASYNASHNVASNLLQAKLMQEQGIAPTHPHLNSCQLYGMSDQITFNLAAKGFNAMKYMPYGQIKEVIPYLIRRAQENTAVSGEMGREYQMITKELNRRKNSKL